MKKVFSIVMSDNIIKVSFGVSLIIVVLVSILIAIFYQKLPPFIPFFNSLPWGTERLFSSVIVITLPVIFLLVIMINNMLSAYLYAKHTLMARMISFNGLLVIILGFLAYLQIILLVL